MSRIAFFSEDIPFQIQQKHVLQKWILSIAASERVSVHQINYIFCSDNYLLEINRQYLQHDYYTDIITFDQSDQPGELAADIFISIERVRENADKEGHSFADELHRVMIHGILHLIGYGDKTPDEKRIMRQKEDTCLSLRK